MASLPSSTVAVLPPTPAAAPQAHPAGAPDAQRPPASIQIAQLCAIFEMHNGLVPGFEFTAEGFDLKNLVTLGLIARTGCWHDLGQYVAGPALVAEVTRNSKPQTRNSSCPPISG